MGKKLKNYIAELQKLLESGEPIGNIETFKKELLVEIQFWQHERLIHLMVTILFALLTMSLIIVSFFYVSLPMLLLLLMLLVLLVPYIRHYYILENGVQTLYTIYEEITRRQKQDGVPSQCMPLLKGVK
ncbi:MAG: hypothetical protein PUG48_06615 [Clostridia bacterium]|nr:hypothetical protein [Clostridia bacterium]